MRIGELAKAVGVDIETIRYYEKAGLLPASARQTNGYRTYGVSQLERLAFVRHCRALDMPLAACGDSDRLIDLQLSRARIMSLRALERQLPALRGCCARPHVAADCGILHELVTAAQHESQTGSKP